MLYGQMEQELIEGEPWCSWLQAKQANHPTHLLEQEQVTVDIYEVLTNPTAQVTTSQSNWLGAISPTSSLYQLISQYLGLSVVNK